MINFVVETAEINYTIVVDVASNPVTESVPEVYVQQNEPTQTGWKLWYKLNPDGSLEGVYRNG